MKLKVTFWNNAIRQNQVTQVEATEAAISDARTRARAGQSGEAKLIEELKSSASGRIHKVERE